MSKRIGPCGQRIRRKNRCLKAGFTLIELMVALAVLFILIAVAAPTMSSYMTRHRIGGAALDVLAAMREARLAAVERNQAVVFRIDAVSHTYEAFIDDGKGSADADLNGIPDNAGNNQYDPGEQMLASASLPPGVTFTAVNFSGNDNFHFDSRGFPLNSANALTGGVVDMMNNKGTTRRIVLITSGHSRVQ